MAIETIERWLPPEVKDATKSKAGQAGAAAKNEKMLAVPKHRILVKSRKVVELTWQVMLRPMATFTYGQILRMTKCRTCYTEI